MELGAILGLIAIALIIFVMFQVHTLFTRKSEPDIIVNNYMQGTDKKIVGHISDMSGTGNEVPIDTITTIRDVGGIVSLDKEKLGQSNITETVSKIKKMRNQ